jgi:hypothetical protein
MSVDFLAGKDDIFGIANAAFVSAAAAAGLAYTAQINFPDVLALPPNVDQIYAECSFVVVTEKQIALSRIGGKKGYQTVGLFAMQVFSPKTDASALRVAQTIASAVRDAFCQPPIPTEVWFRDQRLTPVSGSDTKNQTNVVVTCTYKTVR